MAKKKLTPKYFVLVTFDLHKSRKSQRNRVHAALEELEIYKKLVKNNGQTVKPPDNTFSGLIPVGKYPDPKLLTDYLRQKIKKAIKAEGLKAIFVVTVSPRYSWGVSDF